MTRPRQVKPIAPKFRPPKDIKFNVYTNAEIMAILRSYTTRLDDLVQDDDPDTGRINEIIMLLDRMKFLLGQVGSKRT